MSVVAKTMDGERVAERDIGIGDDHRQIRSHCGTDRSLWLEAAYLSLTDSGWNELMLASLQLNPQSVWYRIVKSSRLRPAEITTPRLLAIWADADPGRWSKLAMRTLASRGWTLEMLATLMSISFATAFRWNRDLDREIAWFATTEFASRTPTVPDDHQYSGIQATRDACSRLKQLADSLERST